MTTAPDFDTPEEAAAAVRNGRAGYVITVYTNARRWIAHREYLPPTKGDATVNARNAMVTAGDACRVVVIGPDGARVHIPAPRELKKGAPTP